MEGEGWAIVEIQRLDADLAEALAASAAADDGGSGGGGGGGGKGVLRGVGAVERHARAVEAVLQGLPSTKAATQIQQAFRAWHGKERAAAAREREREDARAAEHDSEEDKAIIANLCSREDLNYPSAAEVREALRMARGTKARMPEVVRVLRRKASGAGPAARRAYNSPIRAKKRARSAGPVDANELPLTLAFMLHRERARAASASPPSSPPSQSRRDRNRGEELAENHDL